MIAGTDPYAARQSRAGPVFSFEFTCMMCSHREAKDMTRAAFEASMSKPAIARQWHRCSACNGYVMIEQGALATRAVVSPMPNLKGSRLWRNNLARDTAV